MGATGPSPLTAHSTTCTGLHPLAPHRSALLCDRTAPHRCSQGWHWHALSRGFLALYSFQSHPTPPLRSTLLGSTFCSLGRTRTRVCWHRHRDCCLFPPVSSFCSKLCT